MFPRVGEKRRIDDIKIEDEEAIGSLCRLGGRPLSPKTAMEQEKRIRREIANSNERRRMQSINAGFASLKTLLPHHEGEKLSKAAILQQTAEYIYQLEQEKTRLLSQNCQLKRLLNQQQHHADAEGSPAGGDTTCDDGVTTIGDTVASTQVDNGAATEELQREMIDLRLQLDRERRHRMSLEEHIRLQEAQAFPEQRVNEVSKTKPEIRDVKVETTPLPVVTETSVTVVPSTTPMEVTTLRQAPAQVAKPEVEMKKDSPRQSPPRHHSTPQPVPSPVTTATITTTPTAAIATTTTTINQPTARQPTTGTLSRQTVTHSQHNPTQGTIVSASPATTIVTVVPSSKGGVETLPSVFEALTSSSRFGAKVEVEPAPRVPSPEATIEYVEDNKNRTVYIVNSTTAACQKSLDTICEAIRHLEGDHMFQTEEQHPRIEEEIITEETLTIEDHTGQHVTFSGSQVPVTLGGQVTLAGGDEPITLHMVGEPQEVPLELTTHRPSQYTSGQSNVHNLQQSISLTTRPHQSPSHTTTPSSKEDLTPVCSISTTTSSHSSPSQSLLQASRPGVIVVKHP